MYLIAGVAAIIAAIYFISTASSGAGDSFGILDYAILGMGIVAVYRGVKGFLDIRRGNAALGEGPKRITRPGGRSSDDTDKGGKPGDS